jgi:hypothetical protein
MICTLCNNLILDNQSRILHEFKTVHRKCVPERNYPKPHGRGKAQVLLSQLQIKETEDHLKMVMGEEYYE